MKFAWILVLSLVSMRAHAILSEPTRCLATQKQFDIEDEDMRFKSIKILQGKKIRLESRVPGEDLEINCANRTDPQNKNGKYEFVRQEKKISPTASALVAVFSLGVSELGGARDPDLEINNKSEFPLHTKIVVPSAKDEFRVTDTHTGKSFRVECLAPGPSGVRVFAQNKDQKEKVVFYVGSATARTLDVAPKEVDKTKGACVAKRYSLNLSTATLTEGGGMAAGDAGGSVGVSQ